ncbi:XVIPCD domain-containing protein [Lysobacter tyrosinilyticus]
MGGKYRVVESVGNTLQNVHSYEDLEKHHPTWREDPTKRHYTSIDGRREEFVPSPSGERLVSKDFVLMSDAGSAVNVPSPVEGYARRSPKLDRWGTVQIYDGPGKDARLIAQVRHMDPIHVSDGEHIQYGQPLGQQGRKSPPGTKVGLHTHMDVAETHLKEFKQYIHDLDAGVITPDGQLHRSQNASSEQHAPLPQSDKQPAAVAATRKDGQTIDHGDHGAAVRDIQQQLHNLGYVGPQGHPLKVDGDFGGNTEHAVRAFQKAHGLHVDGVIGSDTQKALLNAEKAPLLSEKTHPSHPLFQEAQQGLRQLPSGTFRNTEELNNTAATLAQKAKESGISHIDHVLMNTRGDGVFAVQGNPQDPARHLASVDKGQAMMQSVERSTELMATHDGSRLQSAQVQTQMQHQEHRSGLSMAMRP